MPRIYDSESNPVDYCRKHFPKTEAKAYAIHGGGEGPDDRGDCFAYDAEHPDYPDDPEMYRCYVCGKELGLDD